MKILDNGFIELLGTFGTETDIVRAARMSTNKDSKGAGADRQLIRYLLRNKHSSPFEMVEMKFHVKAPIFVQRQWFRHRTGSYNEFSGRYSEMKEDAYIPSEERFSVNGVGHIKYVASIFDDTNDVILDYKDLLKENISKELARIILPLNTYTEFIFKMDLHNLLNFIYLRNSEHSQYEIRVYAEAIEGMIKENFPNVYEAYIDYVKESVTFSRIEFEYLKQLFKSEKIDDLNNLTKNEKEIFINKIKELENEYA